MKIRKIEFTSNPILGDLSLDFTDENNKAVDTIILAGENGTGKSLILNTIFKFSQVKLETEQSDETRLIEFEFSESDIEILREFEPLEPDLRNLDDNIFRAKYDLTQIGNWNQIKFSAKKTTGDWVDLASNHFASAQGNTALKVLFSDVEVNFASNKISSVTASSLDSANEHSQKSSTNLATQITQLLIDIQNQDALDLAKWARANIGERVEEGLLDSRTKRFTSAFEFMFPSKKYDRVENSAGKIDVIFKEGDNEMSINDLSSGEKQVVFRGSFLLKDLEMFLGSVILIDEPEISLHPLWQLKITTFFKKLFHGPDKKSQMIISTHSPFVVHNANRYEDKVIILEKSGDGTILVSSEPEFHSWSSKKLVKKAFNISSHLGDKLTIFVEGETDEKYLNQAASLFQIDLTDIEIKWIGHINADGNAEFTGDGALNQSKKFFTANDSLVPNRIVLLYDGDTSKPEEQFGELYVRTMEINLGNELYKKGIENLLILGESFQKDDFYSQREKTDPYGATSVIRELDKSKLCEHILELPVEDQKKCLEKISNELIRVVAIASE